MDFLGPELDGDVEKKEKGWIPGTLPAFPSKHTYRFTLAEAPAEDTAKKHADALADSKKTDKALRDLERAGKLREQKEQREIAQRNPLSKQRYDNWDAAVSFFKAQSNAKDKNKSKKEHSVIVDYNARYMRGEVPRSSIKGGP
jgi:transcription initiation factor TFIID subunit 8